METIVNRKPCGNRLVTLEAVFLFAKAEAPVQGTRLKCVTKGRHSKVAASTEHCVTYIL